jgi:hypothetical protein
MLIILFSSGYHSWTRGWKLKDYLKSMCWYADSQIYVVAMDVGFFITKLF